VKIAVIKLGTDSIVNKKGGLNYKIVDKIVDQIIQLKTLGIVSVLVSSGAVAIGKLRLQNYNLTNENRTRIQASNGQAILINKLQTRFCKYGFDLAQVLLTSKDFESNERKSILIHTIYEMLSVGILPVINENDLLSNEELDCIPLFNDNDSLAVNVSLLLSAKWLIILSANIDGLYLDLDNPNKGIIKQVTDIEQISSVISSNKSISGRGGMGAKISAIQKAVDGKVSTFLINGFKPENISLGIKKDLNFLGTEFIVK
jgi:glutamate 5-kinase